MPAITYGLRGLVYEEVFLTGPGHDLHSGAYGGAVPNPANVLCEVLATLHDADGRVNTPGFYDDVEKLTAPKMMQGQTAAITKDGDKLRIGGATITASDIHSSNGIIHAIDKVNVPTGQ